LTHPPPHPRSPLFPYTTLFRSLGVMDVDTRSSGPNPHANFAIVRLKESLWPGSYFGVVGTDKQSGDVQDSFNRTVGAVLDISGRSEEHTSELQSRFDLVCRLLL